MPRSAWALIAALLFTLGCAHTRQIVLPPSQVLPAAGNYVVWVEPRDQAPERKGMLRPDSNLNAQLRFITPDPSFTLVITAENGPNPQAPSDRLIARASKSPVPERSDARPSMV